VQTITCTVDEVVLGIDTHLDSHTAVLVDLVGRQVDARTFPSTRRGVAALIDWANRRGTVRRAGVEGTGSYGVALARRLAMEGIEVFEVTRPARKTARHRGKNDLRDALAAAVAVLGDDRQLLRRSSATASSKPSGCCGSPAPARSSRARRASCRCATSCSPPPRACAKISATWRPARSSSAAHDGSAAPPTARCMPPTSHALAKLVGPENVMAGSDCGFATFANLLTVDPAITWAKLRAMADGAEIASRALY
jgi:hypothetical protein